MVVCGAVALGICLLATGSVWAQALPTAATIESIPLELTMPENYQVISVLEPARRVALVAPADGTIRSLVVPLGAAVRPTQEIAQLDRAEATAWVKMAHAEVREKQAQVKSGGGNQEVSRAQLEAAEARAELAQLALDRLTLRAPFAGRIVSVPVSSGQYVLKGTVIADLADVTGLRSLVPVDRRTASEGRELKVYVEGQEQTAKFQSILPLPEAYAPLRELAAPFAAAWINIQHDKGDLAPGLESPQRDLARDTDCHDSQGGREDDAGFWGIGRHDCPGHSQRVCHDRAGRDPWQGRAGTDPGHGCLPAHGCPDCLVVRSLAAGHARAVFAVT